MGHAVSSISKTLSNPYMQALNPMIGLNAGAASMAMGGSGGVLDKLKAAALNPVGGVSQGWQVPYEQNIAQTGQAALATPGLQADTASGKYLTANPYMNKMVQYAQQPITEQYQQAIAPGTSSKFAAGGRYGSGLFKNQQDQDKQILARQLANTSTQMYGQNYATERALQETAMKNADPLARAVQAAGTIKTTENEAAIPGTPAWMKMMQGAMTGYEQGGVNKGILGGSLGLLSGFL